MKLKIEIKPIVYSHRHKKTPSCFWTMGKYGSGYYDSQTQCYIGLVAHKVRRKVVQRKDKDNNTRSKVICASHWIMQEYHFPDAVLKLTNLKLVQKNRHFVLEKISK